MILDARETRTVREGRPYTVSGAVLNAMDALDVHEAITIDKVLDAVGNRVPIARVQMYVHKHSGDKRFMTSTKGVPSDALLLRRIA